LDYSFAGGAAGKLLSAKDLCSLRALGDIAKAGVSAIKIEGRMRSPVYVAVATRAYREALDRIAGGAEAFDNNAEEKLLQAFNRGGSFTDGYFSRHSGAEMMSVSASKATGLFIGEVTHAANGAVTIKTSRALSPGDGIEIWNEGEHAGTGINKEVAANEAFRVKLGGNIKRGDLCFKTLDKKLNDEAMRSYARDTRKIEAYGAVRAKIGAPLTLTLTAGDITASVHGAAVRAAESMPLGSDELAARLQKSGGSTLKIKIRYIDADDNIFINVRDINELRRAAAAALTERIRSGMRRETAPELNYAARTERAGRKVLTASVIARGQLDAALRAGIKIIYAETAYDGFGDLSALRERAELAGCRIFLRPGAEISAHGLFVRSWGELSLRGPLRADHTFNIFNRRSLDEILRHAESAALSPELNMTQLAGLGGAGTEVMIYGHMTLMTTRQCPVGLYADGGRAGEGLFCGLRGDKKNYYLRDRTGAEFPVIRDCGLCEAKILNGPATDLRDARIFDLPQEYFRLNFTIETERETAEIIRAYAAMLAGGAPRGKTGPKTTRGHFYRGVS